MYRVDEAACTGCGDCVDACSIAAITLADGRASIDQASCVDCGSCADACRQGAIRADEPTVALVATPSGPGLSPLGSPVAYEAPLEPVLPTQIELLPDASRRSRLWPIVGSALVWAARDLLPALLRAWDEAPGRTEEAMTTGRRYIVGQTGRMVSRRQNRWRHGKRGATRT